MLVCYTIFGMHLQMLFYVYTNTYLICLRRAEYEMCINVVRCVRRRYGNVFVYVISIMFNIFAYVFIIDVCVLYVLYVLRTHT